MTDPGWNNIFGSSGSPVDLSVATAAYKDPHNRVTVAFPKLICRTNPKLLEAWIHIGPTDYGIFPLNFYGVGDLFIANLPAGVYVGKNGKFYMRGNVEARDVIIGDAPLGLTFALAEYMVGSGQE